MVYVDKREFKSDLPSQLFHSGFMVLPRFLELGDYLLSNEIVIERKQVKTGDLQESIRLRGRLDQQLKKLCPLFQQVILLIEFDESIDFNLETASENQYWKR